MQRRNHPAGRVVEQDWADADLVAETKVMGLVEKRLILPYRLALVVEDCPTAADPAPLDDRPVRHDRTWLRLHLALNSRPKPSE